MDDGDSFDFEKGQYIHRLFELDGATLTSSDAEGRTSFPKASAWRKNMDAVHVDKIIVVGAPAAWASKKEVSVEAGGKTWTAPVDFTAAQDGRAAFAVVRKVEAIVGSDFKVVFA